MSSGILTLTLDRAEKRNALSSALIERLHQEFDRADLDAGVRVVMVRGAGKDFCAGADLDELLASADADPAVNEASALRLGTLFQKIRSLPKPVVAMVHGRALAGGAGLATACDIVLAAESAQFGYPEIQRGFVPAMVMAILRRLVGEKRGFELVASGRAVSAGEALQLGLVSRVVADAKLEAAVREVSKALVVQSATAFALTKRLFYEQDGKSFAEGIALGAKVNALSRTTPDFRAAIAAFLKK
ncbi:MAG: enoyl-CoA hydratase/isomerase family protein [Gemmatimonadales bacterium]